jgi:membrane-bound metal-dependent hydrolase YbcI (DUF457 family)
MPSPIAHLGAGYAIYRYSKSRLPQDPRHFWRLPLQMVMVAGLSMLPDLDVIPAIIFRDMKAYHNNFSHSFLLAIPVTFLIAGIFHRVYKSNFWLWFFICLISYDLHIIMDALTAKRGVMLFWPLIQNRFVSPIRIFYGLQWGLGWSSLWHLWTVCTESLFVVGLIALASYFDKRRDTTNTISSQKRQ